MDTQINLNDNEWEFKIDGFLESYCDDDGLAKLFSKVLKDREIFIQTNKIAYDLFSSNTIKRILFSGNSFNRGNVTMVIITDRYGYSFMSMDSVCNDLIFSYKFNINSDYSVKKGCEYENENSNIRITLKIQESGEYDIHNIIYF